MDDYGQINAIGSLEFRRTFATSAENLWAYIVDPELRKKWFCSGATDDYVGGTIIFEFDHSQLSDRDPSNQPDADNGFAGEIVEYDPPNKIVFTWPEIPGVSGTKVAITLTQLNENEVELRLVHFEVATGDYRDGVTVGWHTHLDLLSDLINRRERRDFWKRHDALEKDYEKRAG